MPIYIPVDPALDEEKRLRALVPLFQDAARPYPDDPPEVTAEVGHEPVIRYYNTTVQAAVQLGLGDMFKFGADGFCDVTIMDTTIAIPKFRSGVVPSEVKIVGTLWGYTIRVAMKIRSLHVSAGATLGLLAASVELGAAEIQYSVTGLGIDRKLFSAALRKVPLFGKLDYTAYARLQSALVDLSDALGEQLGTRPLLPIGVFVRNNPFEFDAVTEARSVRWAAVQYANRHSWEVAILSAPPWLDHDIAARAYRDWTGKDPGVARDWLKAG